MIIRNNRLIKGDLYYLLNGKWCKEHIHYEKPPTKFSLTGTDWIIIMLTISNILLTFKILCLTS